MYPAANSRYVAATRHSRPTAATSNTDAARPGIAGRGPGSEPAARGSVARGSAARGSVAPGSVAPGSVAAGSAAVGLAAVQLTAAAKAAATARPAHASG